MNVRFRRDALERVSATAVQGVLSVVSAEVIVEVVDASEGTRNLIILALMPVFAGLKAWAAKRVGSPDDASLLRN